MKIKLLSLIAVLTLFTASPAVASPHHHSSHHHDSPAAPVATLPQWRTAGGQYPDATDPTRLLPPSAQHAFQCIRYHESRNHLIDGYGSQGWYQFIPSTWHSGAIALGYPSRLWWSANTATSDQQSAVAVWYFTRNGRFGVQWLADAWFCSAFGRF